MTILVTGATGFLGGYVVDECLRRGDSVRALARAGSPRLCADLEWVTGDVTEPRSLPEVVRGAAVVVHCAGLVRDFGARKDFLATNLTGTRNLLDAARAAGVPRFVFVSSPSAVMTGSEQRDIDESVPYPATFLNPYAQSKALAERLVLAANRPGFVTCALRPRAIWGPGDRRGFLPRLLVRLRRGRLPDLSGPEPVYASLSYAANAALACRLAAVAPAERIGGHSYFVADAEPVDVWQLIARMARLFDLPPPTRRIPPLILDAAAAAADLVWRFPPLTQHEPPVSQYGLAVLTRTGTYNTAAARRDLGYRPSVDLETGLSALHRWLVDIGGVAALTAAETGDTGRHRV